MGNKQNDLNNREIVETATNENSGKLSNEEKQKIIKAIEIDDFKTFKIQMNKIVDLNEIISNIRNGFTALMYACEFGSLEKVKYIIELGADLNTKNSFGSTAIMFATYKGYFDKVELLVSSGANINICSQNGESALSYTTSHGEHLNILNLLLASGVDVKACGGKALIFAVTDRHFESVRVLIEAGVDVNFSDGHGWTPLSCASSRNILNMVEVLMDNGADPTIKNINGKNAIEVATSNEVKEFIQNYNGTKFVLK